MTSPLPTRPLVRAVLAAFLAAFVVAAPAAAFAQAGSGPGLAPRREPSARGLAARERQRKCGAEWRGLNASEKAAQGPRWPQYYSKCVRRLKEQRA
ncbi:hypothetical protein [Methylobacterium platani]|uniref:Uncharacterized protein n=2 Tax=Methylobacterium platani TaxID=427683 RepID=A0A179RYF7_9HYPH|nr:hypothetical protein [Methylobacterium platani]KMO17860.1 hypothetical protein SQ03_11495 [Methylobacterium platani JCM 14648]OAS15948.1 hypothetical protein A5481_28895 [Methylobacterium platani]